VPLDLPPPLAGPAFAVADARALGIGPDRLRRADLSAPHHGVRTRRSPVTLMDRCRALAPVLPPGTAFSHVTALALWQLPLPRGHDVEGGLLHVESTRGGRVRRAGVTGHVGRPDTVGRNEHRVSGLLVVDPLTAWVQSAEGLALDDLVAVADALAGRWSPFGPARGIPIGQLSDRVTAWGSRRGASALREALALARPGVWSPQETRMRLLLERAGVTGLVPNHPVRDERDRLVGIVDLADVDARLAVEYQGDHHRTDRDTYRSDLQRREDFEDVGWRQVQASDDDLGPGSTAFVARVKRLVCERRGTEMSRLAAQP
jgi:hypothetical protein